MKNPTTKQQMRK